MGAPMIIPIMVSHNSEKYIDRFWRSNIKQLGCKVYIVNSSERKIDMDLKDQFEIIEAKENVGFSVANNIGINGTSHSNPDFFLIINPDILLPTNWWADVQAVISDPRYADVGIFTVPLLEYQFEQHQPTGHIDSLGIAHTWYGRWYDILQGEDLSLLPSAEEPYEVPAACGALMLIREFTASRLLKQDGYVFNPSYFMYKEDIELSIRVRRLGQKIRMLPMAPVFHCRGWAKTRSDSPYWARELSAKNELRMHLQFYWRYLPYSAIKYLFVKMIERLLY
jgi:GT2 family glycosyltransferase